MKSLNFIFLLASVSSVFAIQQTWYEDSSCNTLAASTTTASGRNPFYFDPLTCYDFGGSNSVKVLNNCTNTNGVTFRIYNTSTTCSGVYTDYLVGGTSNPSTYNINQCYLDSITQKYSKINCIEPTTAFGVYSYTNSTCGTLISQADLGFENPIVFYADQCFAAPRNFTGFVTAKFNHNVGTNNGSFIYYSNNNCSGIISNNQFTTGVCALASVFGIYQRIEISTISIPATTAGAPPTTAGAPPTTQAPTPGKASGGSCLELYSFALLILSFIVLLN